MQIIAGELKGRKIELPRGSRARPATSFVRELAMNLFSTAAPDGGSLLAQGAFLDLFAASGANGFEALSRGAPFAVFVEADPRHAAAIGRTAGALGVAGRCKVLQTDARRCFKAVERFLLGRRCSAAFVDPPFIPGFAPQFLPYLGQAARLFLPEALVIVRSKEALPLAVDGLRLVESRQGGGGTLFLYRPAPDGEDAADGT
jgi:16S rRNA (guanine966-N2)-methyltransferase